MKILVFGAGVLGSIFAARLHQAGQVVAVLARGARLEEIRQHGIVVEDLRTGDRFAAPVRPVAELGPDDAYDLVLVIVRKEQVASALPALAANRRTPAILFLHNSASGPDEAVALLGRERVLLGFPLAGGVRDGHIIRTYSLPTGRGERAVIGELDGRTSPRLERIAAVLSAAGFGVAISPNMDAWLKTHVAEVSPVACALYRAGGSNYRLAADQEGLRLIVRAVREGIAVLKALSIPITPPSHRLLTWLPEGVLVALLRRLFDSKMAEIAMAGHAGAARGEMRHLADEFRALALRASVPTPSIDRLHTYLDAADASSAD